MLFLFIIRIVLIVSIFSWFGFPIIMITIKRKDKNSKESSDTQSNSPQCLNEDIHSDKYHAYCEYCGAVVKRGIKKCSSCGAKIRK